MEREIERVKHRKVRKRTGKEGEKREQEKKMMKR
jgi:hypothetical protein